MSFDYNKVVQKVDAYLRRKRAGSRVWSLMLPERLFTPELWLWEPRSVARGAAWGTSWAIAPVPLATFAGAPSQSVGISFIKSYAAVCLEGAIIVLACIIFAVFASTPPVVNTDAAAVSMVWSYVGELIFNMLVLVGAVKMSDRVVREMMGL